MIRLFLFFAVISCGTHCLPRACAEPAKNGLTGLAAALRPVILQALPKPLYEKSENWGNTAMAVNQIKLRRLRPQFIKTPKNEGTWRKTTVTARSPETSLEFNLSDLKPEGADRLTFKAFLALEVHVEHEEEIWEKGLRLFRDDTEARVRIKAHLDLETTMRLEKNPQSFIPDTVFRLRVIKADVSYDNLVFEHLAGLGGTGARWTGEALRGLLKQWKPSIERELLAKANAAILKAADTRDVRISLGNLISQLAETKK